jgi:hypothetical protein
MVPPESAAVKLPDILLLALVVMLSVPECAVYVVPALTKVSALPVAEEIVYVATDNADKFISKELAVPLLKA